MIENVAEEHEPEKEIIRILAKLRAADLSLCVICF